MSPSPARKTGSRNKPLKSSGNAAIPGDVTDIPIDDLVLDPENPRLAEYQDDGGETPLGLIRSLWTLMAVEEVAMSIAYNGYFRHEPLIVEKKGAKYIVLEGNRRLAAVRLLLDADLRQKVGATNLPVIDQIDAGRRAELQTLPCVVTTREAVWRYLGFKHVNGPATWGSYAKAKYIALVHNEYKVPLEEIALQIGDANATAERLYRGLMVIEQAEEEGLFSRPNSHKKFHFSHIYTGLDKPGISSFIGLDKKTRNARRPVPTGKLTHLKELCRWLYGDKAQEIEPVMKTQNPDLKILDAVLQDAKGLRSLRDGLPLGVSYDAAQGDEQLFRAALQNSKQFLQRAHATLTTGYDPKDSDALKVADDVEDLAIELHRQMLQKRQQRSRPARKG